MSNNAPNSSLLRIVVPLAAVLLGLLVVFSVTGPGDKKSDTEEQDQSQTDGQSKDQADKGDTPPKSGDDKPKKDADPGDDPDVNPDKEPKPKPVGITLTESDLGDELKAFALKPGDTIVNINGQPPTSLAELNALILSGKEIKLLVRRPGEDKLLTITPDGAVKVDEPDKAEPDKTEKTADVGPLDNLRPKFDPAPESRDESTIIKIGSLDTESDYELLAEINPYRACVHRVTLTNTKQRVTGDEPYILLHPADLNIGDTDFPTIGSYAAEFIVINGQKVKLFEHDKDAKRWLGDWTVTKGSESSDSVTLTMTIEGGPDDDRKPVARITRSYRVSPDSYSIQLDQTVTNLSGEALTITWQQLAQTDVHFEKNDYLRGRSRQYVTGYFREDHDPQHFSVYTDKGFIPRPDLVKDLSEESRWESVWPIPKLEKSDEVETLVWLASDNRFFAAISSAGANADAKETGDVVALEAVYPAITTVVYPSQKAAPKLTEDERFVLIGLVSQELTLEPGKTTKPDDLSLNLYAGPRKKAVFGEAPYSALGFEKTIRYSLGGMCGCCTFQWLANLLLAFLTLLHAVVFDWGIAIIILVLCVRLCLHPLTKRGQINMMKMGKQMAAVQPELNKLKKKFADDPRQMQQAQMQLFREKGINPAAGALGCLPMLLQMPIWIALYAMLYYAFELRHQPAFYGVFQNLAGWPFLADLSSADRFIPLFANDGEHVLDLWLIRFDYSSINILPILMGITFFINMKYTTPPPMNEQQATQQKIMKIMPLIFPFFLYSAPAGLTLYICASTFAGIIDSRIVRKHVKELEESGELFKPKAAKPGGFMDRLQKAAEMRAQQMEEMKKQQNKNKGPQNYKKRKR